MSRIAKLQLIGPIAVFLTVAAAEAAVFLLAQNPTSELLWYVNLKFFGVFQRAHYLLGDVTTVPASQLLLIALPTCALACYGFVRRRALALAVASNLSFVYAAFLMVSWNIVEKATQQASLSFVVVPSGPGLYTLMMLIGTSLISFIVSHLLYLRSIRACT